MKNNKTIIILLAVLIVLGGAFWYVNSQKTPDNANTGKLIKLYETNAEKIKGFNITGGKYDYYFGKDKNDDWVLNKPSADVYSSNIEKVAFEAVSIYAEKEIVSNADEKQLKGYGFDKPITLTVIDEKKNKHVFEFGNAEPNKTGYYFREQSSSTVYLASNYKAQTIMTDFKALADKVLIKCNQSNINGFKLKKNGKVVFDVAYEASSKNYRILAPINCTARYYTIEELLPKLTDVEVDDVYGIDASNPKYGFSKPTYVVTVKLKDKTSQTIIVGKQYRVGIFYAKKPNSNNVVLLQTAKVNFIDMPLKDMMDNFTYLQDITKVKKMELTYKGVTDKIRVDYFVNKNGEKDSEKYIFNGYDVTNLNNDNAKMIFKEMYSGIVGITWYDVDFSVKPQLKDVVLKVKYTTSDNKQTTVEYAKKNSEYTYCFVNGKYTGLIVNNDMFKSMNSNRVLLNSEIKRRFK